MRRFILIASLVLGFAAHATPNITAGSHFTVTCLPASGYQEFKSFTVTIDDNAVSLAATAGKESAVKVDNVTTAPYDAIHAIHSDISDVGNGLEIHQFDFTFSVDDYATVGIELREDDNGLAGLVDYDSDGPHNVSFYRCQSVARAQAK